MPEQKKTNDKKLSLHPLEFEEALKGLLATPPPKEEQEKKDKPLRSRKRSAGKKPAE